MIVSLIAAVGKGRILGSSKGGIPWDLPLDRAHFRTYTTGKWLLVGRRTYEEMDGWFGERCPIVLTRSSQARPSARGHRVAASVPTAISLAKNEGASELVVCGGAAVYAAAFPFAERLVLTLVDWQGGPEDDAPRFPDWATQGRWRPLYREHWPASGQNPHAATLTVLVRSSRPGLGER